MDTKNELKNNANIETPTERYYKGKYLEGLKRRAEVHGLTIQSYKKNDYDGYRLVDRNGFIVGGYNDSKLYYPCSLELIEAFLEEVEENAAEEKACDTPSTNNQEVADGEFKELIEEKVDAEVEELEEVFSFTPRQEKILRAFLTELFTAAENEVGVDKEFILEIIKDFEEEYELDKKLERIFWDYRNEFPRRLENE